MTKLEELMRDANLTIEIDPKAFTLMAEDRKALIAAQPTFMNCCKGGACDCTGDDIEEPDSFEVAAATAWQAISDIYYAPHHKSHKIAIFEALEKRIQKYKDMSR